MRDMPRRYDWAWQQNILGVYSATLNGSQMLIWELAPNAWVGEVQHCKERFIKYDLATHAAAIMWCQAMVVHLDAPKVSSLTA